MSVSVSVFRQGLPHPAGQAGETNITRINETIISLFLLYIYQHNFISFFFRKHGKNTVLDAQQLLGVLTVPRSQRLVYTPRGLLRGITYRRYHPTLTLYNPKAARWRPTHSVTALGSSLYRSQLYPYRGLQRYHATLTQAQPQALTLTARPRLRRPRRANACAEPRARLTRRETEGASPRVAQMPTLDSTKLMSKQL